MSATPTPVLAVAQSTKERPIFFSGAMVRALLAGTKTQTRRPVKHPERFQGGVQNCLWCCPYGQPGDRLWVRETWSGEHCYQDEKPSERVSFMTPDGPFFRDCVWYWADGQPEFGDWERPRPSIHMPRWASRILLEITEVRVERLQDISEADALAEGITARDVIVDTRYEAGQHREIWEEQYLHGTWPCQTFETAAEAYADLWDSINGTGAWESNPWVWAVSFKRIDPEAA